MKDKQFLCMSLAVALTVAGLAGCGSTSSDSTASSATITTETVESGSAAEQSVDTAESSVGELKGPGNITLSFLGFNLDFDPNTDVMAKCIEDSTGYRVEYSMLPSDQADEKLIADVAGGVKYDILKVTQDQFQKLLAQGALMPLNDLLDTYGKDIENGLADKEMWSAFSDAEGSIYGIPFMREYANQIDYVTYRKDLAEAAGITESPTTLDEFYNFLKALKDHYGDDYIVVSGYDGWDGVSKIIASAFGIYNDWMVDDNGKVYYMTEAPEFKKYIKNIKKLYDEGLLDSEYAVNTKDTVLEKLSSGQAIAGTCNHSDQISVTTSWIDNLGLTQDDVGYINPLYGDDGTCKYLDGASVNYVTCILKDSDNAADAINFINLKVQDQENICIGVEGTDWEFDENGNYKPIMPAFADHKTFAWWYINATDTETYAKQWMARIRKSDYQWNAFENTTLYVNENAPEIFVSNKFLHKPATGAYIENNAALKNDLHNYMLQVISNTSDLDSGLDTFKSDWTSAGGEDVKRDLQTWYAENN